RSKTQTGVGRRRGLRPLALGTVLSLLMLLYPVYGLTVRGPGHPGLGLQSQSQTGPPASQTKQVQEPVTKQDETIHLSSRLVLVPISASDSSGQPVKDLTAADIVIEEDGRPQQVVPLGKPGETPIDLALLVDVSGSTQKQFAFEQQAAVQFLRDVLK